MWIEDHSIEQVRHRFGLPKASQCPHWGVFIGNHKWCQLPLSQRSANHRIPLNTALGVRVPGTIRIFSDVFVLSTFEQRADVEGTDAARGDDGPGHSAIAVRETKLSGQEKPTAAAPSAAVDRFGSSAVTSVSSFPLWMVEGIEVQIQEAWFDVMLRLQFDADSESKGVRFSEQTPQRPEVTKTDVEAPKEGNAEVAILCFSVATTLELHQLLNVMTYIIPFAVQNKKNIGEQRMPVSPFSVQDALGLYEAGLIPFHVKGVALRGDKGGANSSRGATPASASAETRLSTAFIDYCPWFADELYSTTVANSRMDWNPAPTVGGPPERTAEETLQRIGKIISFVTFRGMNWTQWPALHNHRTSFLYKRAYLQQLLARRKRHDIVLAVFPASDVFVSSKRLYQLPPSLRKELGERPLEEYVRRPLHRILMMHRPSPTSLLCIFRLSGHALGDEDTAPNDDLDGRPLSSHRGGHSPLALSAEVLQQDSLLIEGNEQQMNNIFLHWLQAVALHSSAASILERKPKLDCNRLSLATLNILMRLHQQYASIETSGDGTVDADELHQALGALTTSARFVRALFLAFDEDRDGAVTFAEFLNGMVDLLFAPYDLRLRFIFRMFNESNHPDGVKLSEFIDVLTVLQLTGEFRLEGVHLPDFAKQLFAALDVGQVGRIHYQRYVDGLENDAAVYQVLCDASCLASLYRGQEEKLDSSIGLDRSRCTVRESLSNVVLLGDPDWVLLTALVQSLGQLTTYVSLDSSAPKETEPEAQAENQSSQTSGNPSAAPTGAKLSMTAMMSFRKKLKQWSNRAKQNIRASESARQRLVDPIVTQTPMKPVGAESFETASDGGSDTASLPSPLSPAASKKDETPIGALLSQSVAAAKEHVPPDDGGAEASRPEDPFTAVDHVSVRIPPELLKSFGVDAPELKTRLKPVANEEKVPESTASSPLQEPMGILHSFAPAVFNAISKLLYYDDFEKRRSLGLNDAVAHLLLGSTQCLTRLHELPKCDDGNNTNDEAGAFNNNGEKPFALDRNQFAFVSHDQALLIKSITETEALNLLDALKRYASHLEQNPHTLLPRHLGLFALEEPSVPSQYVLFTVVINPIFTQDRPIDAIFFLTGQPHRRPHRDESITHSHTEHASTGSAGDRNPSQVSSAMQHHVRPLEPLHETHFRKPITLLEDWASALHSQLAHDTAFLIEIGAVSYSLMLAGSGDPLFGQWKGSGRQGAFQSHSASNAQHQDSTSTTSRSKSTNTSWFWKFAFGWLPTKRDDQLEIVSENILHTRVAAGNGSGEELIVLSACNKVRELKFGAPRSAGVKKDRSTSIGAASWESKGMSATFGRPRWWEERLEICRFRLRNGGTPTINPHITAHFALCGIFDYRFSEQGKNVRSLSSVKAPPGLGSSFSKVPAKYRQQFLDYLRLQIVDQEDDAPLPQVPLVGRETKLAIRETIKLERRTSDSNRAPTASPNEPIHSSKPDPRRGSGGEVKPDGYDGRSDLDTVPDSGWLSVHEICFKVQRESGRPSWLILNTFESTLSLVSKLKGSGGLGGGDRRPTLLYRLGPRSTFSIARRAMVTASKRAVMLRDVLRQDRARPDFARCCVILMDSDDDSDRLMRMVGELNKARGEAPVSTTNRSFAGSVGDPMLSSFTMPNIPFGEGGSRKNSFAAPSKGSPMHSPALSPSSWTLHRSFAAAPPLMLGAPFSVSIFSFNAGGCRPHSVESWLRRAWSPTQADLAFVAIRNCEFPPRPEYGSMEEDLQHMICVALPGFTCLHHASCQSVNVFFFAKGKSAPEVSCIESCAVDDEVQVDVLQRHLGSDDVNSPTQPPETAKEVQRTPSIPPAATTTSGHLDAPRHPAETESLSSTSDVSGTFDDGIGDVGGSEERRMSQQDPEANKQSDLRAVFTAGSERREDSVAVGGVAISIKFRETTILCMSFNVANDADLVRPADSMQQWVKGIQLRTALIQKRLGERMGSRGIGLTNEFHHCFFTGEFPRPPNQISTETNGTAPMNPATPMGKNEPRGPSDPVSVALERHDIFPGFTEVPRKRNEGERLLDQDWDYPWTACHAPTPLLSRPIREPDPALGPLCHCTRVLHKSLGHPLDDLIDGAYDRENTLVHTSPHNPVSARLHLLARLPFPIQIAKQDKSRTSCKWLKIQNLRAEGLHCVSPIGLSTARITFHGNFFSQHLTENIHRRTTTGVSRQLNPVWHDIMTFRLREILPQQLFQEYLFLEVTDQTVGAALGEAVVSLHTLQLPFQQRAELLEAHEEMGRAASSATSAVGSVASSKACSDGGDTTENESRSAKGSSREVTCGLEMEAPIHRLGRVQGRIRFTLSLTVDWRPRPISVN